MTTHWTFGVEPGFFTDLAALQDEQPEAKFTTQPQLGLIPRDYPTDSPDASDKRDWRRFAAYVSSLNREAPENVTYKVLYLTRHGFGYHNKKHAEVGTVEWDRYWSLMDGADGETWFDAFLTDQGIQQAKDLSEFWTDLIDTHGAPLPQTIYTSPLARCLQTTQYAFRSLMESHGQAFHPIVKEKIRERFTVHTCDKRRPRSWIEKMYPDYRAEESLAETDPYGDRDYPEEDEEHKARKQAALEEVFSSDENEFIELTMHSYAIRSTLMACNSRHLRVREGSSIAILVRGEKISGSY